MATEINACIQFLDKAVSFVTSVPRRWYKGSSELDLFETRVNILQAKFATYKTLLTKARLQDKLMLKQLAMEGTCVLEKETEHLTKVQRSGLSRLKYRTFHRAFPGQLEIILTNIEDILNAGPQLLQFNSDMFNLVEKTMTSPLPFGQDRNYVPIVRCVDEVREALENEHECHVVTICGEPGLGKTSLVKYIALLYQPHHTPQGSGETSSSTVFPGGVFFLQCGKGAQRRIKQLQQYLLQSLGCPSEAVPGDIPEEHDGDYVTVPTFRRRLQFKLGDLKALIIIDDVWERPVLEELILSLDEAPSVKYLLTSQIMDIWPDARGIAMKRPTFKEARQILLKYTQGLSSETRFPKNIKGKANLLIRNVDFHPLILANVGLGFRQQEGQDPEAWSEVEAAWEHEPQIKTSYKPLIYGREYPLALDKTMTRIMVSFQKPARDLLFLISALRSNFHLPETAVKYLYKCAEIGDMSEYKYVINLLQNSSLVDVYSYPYGRVVVIHKLRALSIISQFSSEIRVVIGRALKPLREMYNCRDAQATMIGGLMRLALQATRDVYCNHILQPPLIRARYYHHSLQMPLIGARYYDSVNGNSGLLNASMVGMYVHKRYLGDAQAEIPRGVDFAVEDLLKTAGEKEPSLRDMVTLLHLDPGGEGLKKEAARCAEKIITKFACRHELDDESVRDLIQLPEARVTVLSFLLTMFEDGYWQMTFFEDNKTFSSAHSQIAKNLSALVHDDATSTETLITLVEVLFGGSSYYGMLDYEDDDTIVNIGKRLITLALGANANIISSEGVRLLKFRSSHLRTFRVLQKKIPDLLQAMLTSCVQERVPCEWFESLLRESNAASEVMHDTRVLEKLCTTYDHVLEREFWQLLQMERALEILEWLCLSAENREIISTDPKIVETIVCTLVRGVKEEDHTYNNEIVKAARVLGKLALSQKTKEEILSIYPETVEALEHFEQRHTLDETLNNMFCNDGHVCCQALGVLHASAIHIKISDFNPPISKCQYEEIIEGRLRGCYDKEMYEEFLAVTEEDLFPTRTKRKLKHQIIVAKVISKRYSSALADADENLVHAWKTGPYFRMLHESAVQVLGLRVTAHALYTMNLSWALGLRGTVGLLSGENLSEALRLFETAVHVLSRTKEAHGTWSRLEREYYQVLMYYILKQRGFTKHLMGNDSGAREDATYAQELQHRNLVWNDVSSFRHLRWRYDPMGGCHGADYSLFNRPLTYLGFNFTC